MSKRHVSVDNIAGIGAGLATEATLGTRASEATVALLFTEATGLIIRNAVVGPGLLVSFGGTILVAGTAQQIIIAPTPVKIVTVSNPATNTGALLVGDLNVDATSTPPMGVWIEPGDSYTFEIGDLSLVWIDAQVSGESYCGMYGV